MGRAVGPNDDTSAGHKQWTHRVMKERAVNGVIRKDGFSVRSVVRRQDVPLRFKLTHPIQSGPGGVSRDVQAALDSQHAFPRQRFFLPETTQHDVGWHSPESPAASRRLASDRVALAGRMPTCNIGWSASTPKGGTPAVSPRQSAQPTPSPRNGGWCAGQESAIEPTVVATPRSRVAALGLAGQSSPRHQVTEKSPRQREVVPGPFPGSICTEGPSPSDPWLDDSYDRAKGVTSPPPEGCEEAVRTALEGGRQFLNKPGNKWYKPKGTSDVVQFGDAYVRSFGKSLFALQ
eukprot:TRINITY_DN74104_c0_g1_i1.p1 TRINITY_DN74104_c0_g1~~TRINITY_DN74104_c0_g1_i1.p1  ORF type:complete len:290 (-),score=36.69 TRINITY_DN74104_c0_g1_i1:104-973(-)